MSKNLARLSLGIIITLVMVQSVMADADFNLLRDTTVMDDGRVKIGKLSVVPGENGKEAKVEIIRFDSTGNGTVEHITVGELGKAPCDLPEFSYGVSEDNDLLLIKADGDNNIKIIRDLNGNYDLKDIQDSGTSMRDLIKVNYVLVDGARMADGRIKIK